MPLAGYAHWNEDAHFMWWHEEGKHESIYEPPDPEFDEPMWEPGEEEDDD